MLTLCLMESGPIWLRDGDFRSFDIRHFCKSLSDATPGKIFECLVARNRNIGVSGRRYEVFVPFVCFTIYSIISYYQNYTVKYRLDSKSKTIPTVSRKKILLVYIDLAYLICMYVRA